MSLDDLGNLGEIIGGLAVVVSLVYLATQIRHTGRIARFDAHRSLSLAMSEIMADLARDPELYRIWNQMTDDPDNATKADRERFGLLMYRSFANFSDADRFVDIDAGLRERYDIFMHRLLGFPAVRGWWARQRISFAEPFRSKIDAYVADNYPPASSDGKASGVSPSAASVSSAQVQEN